jgi:transcriptional regulator with XRE-family HTH domain
MTPREWRMAKGLTQADVASEIGCVVSHVSMLEHGKRNPTYDIYCVYKNLSNGAVEQEDWAKIAPSSSTRTDAAPPVN